jgi:glycerol-1-phosphate dehydrogenase [NAD(P)+]
VIIADTKTLREAPLEYTMGGIGDMCAMFMAFADWYLNDFFRLGKYFQGSWHILEDVNDLMFAYADEIGRRTPLGMEVLAKILTLGGLTMTYSRESSPVSGYEHVISHMLDMGAPFWGRRVANHGSQVAVAAIPGLIGLNWFLDEFDPKQLNIDECYPTFEEMETRVRHTFDDTLDSSGAISTECWNDYRQKLQGWYDARPLLEEFLANWEEQKAHIKSLIMEPEPYVKALAAAGHPLNFEELNICVPEDQARWAYHNAHLMRKRFSSGDLINYFGWFTEAWTERVFARMHQLIKEARE